MKAFEANAVDYLLKPFSQERFNKAISKWLDLNGKPEETINTNLLQQVSGHPAQQQRVVVKTGTKIKIIPLHEIHYLEAADDYVKIYTDILPEEYDKLVEEAKLDGSKRLVQKYLAYSVTKLVHGDDEANKARDTAESLFGGEKMNLDNLESFNISEYANLVEFLVENKILGSKREAREMLESGAIYINDEKYSEEILDVSKIKLADTYKKEFLLRVGKKKYYRVVF